MRYVLLACFVVTFSILALMAHAAIANRKAIAILHMPRILFAGRDLGFQVRVLGAVDEDREEWAILCNREDVDPCSVDHNERVSMVSIEGSAAPKLWSPRPWTHMPEGEYAVVVALGAHGALRVSDVLTVSVIGQ